MMAAPWMGDSQAFRHPERQSIPCPKPPPDLKSEQYAKDYNEVKAVGAKTNSTRTPEQTELANFYTFGQSTFVAHLPERCP